MMRFVLDTSVFTNPEVYARFAPEPHDAIKAFLALAREANAEFHMPTSVYEEFGKMRDLQDQAAAFEAVVHIRSPRRYNIMIPGALLHDLIDEVRERVDRGLRIAEEHARLTQGLGSNQDSGEVINKLRGKYREALRQGILDSKEDADVLLLAWELEGALVSADQGLRKWADRAGIEIVQPDSFPDILRKLQRPRGDQQSNS